MVKFGKTPMFVVVRVYSGIAESVELYYNEMIAEKRVQELRKSENYISEYDDVQYFEVLPGKQNIILDYGKE